MREVAERAGINRALIYHYFYDRDNLIFETTRYIVNCQDEIRSAYSGGEFEQNQLHIGHREVARFFFHLMLTGKHLPALSRRITAAIEALEVLKAANPAASALDPTFAVIGDWVTQLAWSCAREEIARLLGLPVQEADRRYAANANAARELIRRPLKIGERDTS